MKVAFPIQNQHIRKNDKVVKERFKFLVIFYFVLIRGIWGYGFATENKIGFLKTERQVFDFIKENFYADNVYGIQKLPIYGKVESVMSKSKDWYICDYNQDKNLDLFVRFLEPTGVTGFQGFITWDGNGYVKENLVNNYFSEFTIVMYDSSKNLLKIYNECEDSLSLSLYKYSEFFGFFIDDVPDVEERIEIDSVCVIFSKSSFKDTSYYLKVDSKELLVESRGNKKINKVKGPLRNKTNDFFRDLVLLGFVNMESQCNVELSHLHSVCIDVFYNKMKKRIFVSDIDSVFFSKRYITEYVMYNFLEGINWYDSENFPHFFKDGKYSSVD